MKLLRKISFPFIPAYYAITWSRNKMYDTGILKSRSYDLPIICVGNLSVGGTGKTPMVEYLVRLLNQENALAILSRGYKRKTNGFVLADKNATAETIGDEPMQFHEKFDSIKVAVDADRRNGISELMKLDIDAIILDDAFQHRKVKAGLNIVLTTFSNPYYKDYVLPTGNLREPRNGAFRADIIVVTKCPVDLTDSQKTHMIKRIKPASHQEVFFSWIRYDDIPSAIKQKESFTLVTGIANPKPLVEHLEAHGLAFEHMQFKDHHAFSSAEIQELQQKELILTTEKDHVRLKGHIDATKLFYLPIKLLIDKPSVFETRIKDFVGGFKRH